MSNRGSELGTLVIVILKAKNLNDKHSFYKQDVFAQATINGVTQRTKVAVKGGQHPEWDEEVRFPIMKQSEDKYRKLEVACFAKEPKSDDILGKGEVDINDTLKSGEFDDWVPLNIDGVVRGDLYLEMTFFSNAPVSASSLAAPSSNLQRRPSKLAPSERLSRPPQTYAPQGGRYNSSSSPSVQSGPQPSRPHASGSHASGHHQSAHQARPHHSQFPPVANPAAQTAALHNLLSDGPSGGQQPYNGYRAPSGQRLQTSPPSPRPSSASSRRADSPLPPLPEGEGPSATAPLPSTLLPGGGRPRPQQSPSPDPHATPQLPSTLRAGSGRSVSQPVPPSQHPTHSRHSSADSVGRASHLGDYFAVPGSQAYATGPTLPHTLIAGNAPHMVGLPTPTYYPPPSTVLAPTPPYVSTHVPALGSTTHWGPEASPAGPLSFPVPMPYTPIFGETNSHGHGGYAPPAAQTYYTPQVDHAMPPPPHVQPLAYRQPSLPDDRPDPYLQARYQTPLPLPPGTESPPQGRQSLPPPGLDAAPTNPDAARIEALRQIEAGAGRRKAQEDKDLALALALDRELNLEGEGEPTPTGAKTHSTMPGQW